MTPRSTDPMTRLAAADPTRGTRIDESERARVWQLIAATPDGSAVSARAGSPLRRRLLVFSALLVTGVAALAAVGVIRIDASAETGGGFSAALRGGGLVQASPGLLPVTAPGGWPAAGYPPAELQLLRRPGSGRPPTRSIAAGGLAGPAP